MIPDHLKTQILTETPNIHGWTTPERCVELAELVFQYKPKLCVEIGTFAGRSAFAIGLALKSIGSGQLCTIDPFRHDDALEAENDANRAWWSTVDLDAIHTKMVKDLWRLGLEKWVIPIRAASQNCYGVLGGIDLLFIDGNHSEVASCRDVELYLPRVNRGGIVEMDDADWPSTQKAIGMLGQECDMVKNAGHWRIYRKR